MTIHEKGQWNAEKRKKGEDGRTGEKLPIKKVEKKPDDFVLDLEQSVPLPKPTVMPRPPIYPQKPIVNEVKEAPGISEDFVRLQTAIRKNIDYVLGTDQKDRKNTGEDKAKTIEVSINAVSDVLRDSKKRNITNGNAKNKSTD